MSEKPKGARLPGWKDLAIGGLIEKAGNAQDYETGSWRVKRPIWHKEKCTNCLLCWIHCPDSSILLKDGQVVGIDMEHCKGCGICARECPVKDKAVTMLLETECESH
ncbi:MAG: 4Fe-4S binding protein [Candidatus Eisenbacteria bacterium]